MRRIVHRRRPGRRRPAHRTAATGADDGPYRVRAVFDNGSFLVKDEDVQIAGAGGGLIESVDVSERTRW